MLRTLATVVLLFSAAAHAHDHAEKAAPKVKPGPISVVDGKQIYGAEMPDTGKVVSIGNAIKGYKAGAGEQRVSGEITQICQKEGCWMVLTEGDQFARVMTKHKFFFEKDLRGKAVAYGKLEKKDLTLERSKHMAEDSGVDPKTVTKPTSEFSIVATSVVVEPAK